MTSLYQLSQEFVASLESAFDADTGEALPSFEQNHSLVAGKMSATGLYIIDKRGDVAKAKNEIARLERYVKCEETKIAALEKCMAINMRFTGITTVNGLGFTAVLQIDRDESVELDDGIAWPVSLCNEPKPPTPSKTKIKAAIMAGEPVAGARIVKSDRLTIK